MRVLFKLLLLLICMGFISLQTYANDCSECHTQIEIQNTTNVSVYMENNKFGLQNTENTKITDPIYKKLIRLGNYSWIVQYKNKFGIIDNQGNYIIKPKYRNADRIMLKYVKLGNDNNYGLYDEYGNIIIKPEYSSINALYGNMFLTCKNYKYGICDINGNIILENEFDDIYMPKKNIMMVQYDGRWCEIERISEEAISLPQDINKLQSDKDFKITNLVVNTGVGAGYSVLTFTDYVIKLFSSISPAYEATIDELMFSQGAETINILMKFSWLPKFPIVYAKHYYKNMRNPNSGMLNTQRNTLKKQLR